MQPLVHLSAHAWWGTYEKQQPERYSAFDGCKNTVRVAELSLQISKLKSSYKENNPKTQECLWVASSKKLIQRPNSSKKKKCFKGFWCLQVQCLKAEINDWLPGICRHWGAFAFKTAVGTNENNPRQKEKNHWVGQILKNTAFPIFEKNEQLLLIQLLLDQRNGALCLTSVYFAFPGTSSWAQKLQDLFATHLRREVKAHFFKQWVREALGQWGSQICTKPTCTNRPLIKTPENV